MLLQDKHCSKTSPTCFEDVNKGIQFESGKEHLATSRSKKVPADGDVDNKTTWGCAKLKTIVEVLSPGFKVVRTATRQLWTRQAVSSGQPPANCGLCKMIIACAHEPLLASFSRLQICCGPSILQPPCCSTQCQHFIHEGVHHCPPHAGLVHCQQEQQDQELCS